jgi:hypothetical protein
MEAALKLYKTPRLRNPFLVAGWPDAGQVGIKAISYLKDKLGAEEFGEIEMYDFSLMPNSVIKGGVMMRLEFPKAEFSYYKSEKIANDLIIFRSGQPALNQHKFVSLILDLAQQFGVQRIYTVGGLYAKTPHTVRAKVLVVLNKRELWGYLKDFDVKLGVDYHGPTSMGGLLIGTAKMRGIEGVSLWGQVPNYIAEMPNPSVSQDVLEVLTAMVNAEIDMTEIKAEAESVEKELDRIIGYIRQQQPEFDEYIKRLEQGVETESLRLRSEELFKEIEKFLKGEGGQ